MESSCIHLNFRYRTFFEQEVSRHLDNCIFTLRVYVTWKNTHRKMFLYKSVEVHIFLLLLLLLFYLGFLSRTFTIQDSRGKGRVFNFSLPLPPASQTLKQPSRLPQRAHLRTQLAARLGSHLCQHIRNMKLQFSSKDIVNTFLKQRKIKNCC